MIGVFCAFGAFMCLFDEEGENNPVLFLLLTVFASGCFYDVFVLSSFSDLRLAIWGSGLAGFIAIASLRYFFHKNTLGGVVFMFAAGVLLYFYLPTELLLDKMETQTAISQQQQPGSSEEIEIKDVDIMEIIKHSK